MMVAEKIPPMDALIARKKSEEQRNWMIGGDVCVRITVPILNEHHIYIALRRIMYIIRNITNKFNVIYND